MKIVAGILIYAWLLGTTGSLVLAQTAEPSEQAFAGTIGKTLKIQMKLKIMGSEVSGTYFYKKHKTDIQLQGTLDDQKNLILNEFDEKGNITGIFKGKFVSQNKIAGTWSKPDGTRPLPFVVELKTGKSSGQDIWAGDWTRAGSTQYDNASVMISEVTATSFQFEINVQSGSHLGQITGTAKINQTQAIFKEDECQVDFILKENTLTIRTTEGCSAYGGRGVHFDGTYQAQAQIQKPTLRELGVLQNDEQEQAFSRLAGKDYDLFLESFQLIAEKDDLDNFGASVHSGGVRGLFTIVEAIVMVGSQGKIWAAVIDDEAVKYFTNDPDYAARLPKTIESWRERFSDKKVLFVSAQ
jgi:hypothetical protein